jgi:hypothetical protein
LITRNSPYFGGINLNDLSQYFINGALVRVSSGTDTVILTEFCTFLLPEDVKRDLITSFGYELSDSTEVPDICIYTVPNIINYFLTGDTTVVCIGKELGKYDLYIEVDNKVLTASTSIPGLVPVENMYERPHPDDKKDSLVSVYVTFTEPDTLGNFLRYFTSRNDEQFYPPLSGSVYDDKLFNGATYSLPLERGQSASEEFDLDTYSYFTKGDTVTVRWCTLDKAHYDFWRTIENDGGDSPFSAPVKIQTNIQGGLGIWGGYGCSYATYIVPE